MEQQIVDPRVNPQMAKAMGLTARWVEDRWAYLTECCWTEDEVGEDTGEIGKGSGRVRLIPNKPHLYHLTRQWESERLLAVVKSRRMIVTWTLICLDLHMAMFSPYSHIYIVSSDQANSDKLVGRCKFVYDKLPTTCLKPSIVPTMGKMKNPTRLDFPETHSFIQGLPSSPDKMRQEGATLLHVEELAFWEHPDLSFKAMLPTIQGGGRMVIASSAQAGTEFGRIVMDDLGDAVTK